MTVSNQVLKQLLDKSSVFFNDLDDYISFRAKGLENGAVGDSRYMSLFEGMVFQANAQHTLKALDKMAKKVDQRASHSFSWISRFVPSALAGQTRDNARVQQKLAEIENEKDIKKVKRYLLRAEEALDELHTSSFIGTAVIPVHGHRILLDKVNKLRAQLDELLQAPEIKKVSVEQKRSWFAPIIKKGLWFVRLRIDAHGLMSKSAFPSHYKHSKEELKSNRQIVLADLTRTADLLETVDDKSLQPSVVTRKLVGSEAKGYNPVLYRYFPQDFEEAMDEVKANLDKKGNRITAKSILASCKLNFPKP